MTTTFRGGPRSCLCSTGFPSLRDLLLQRSLLQQPRRPEWDIFYAEADAYIRSFGLVPCAAVDPSRLRNLLALFSKLKQMYSGMDPSWAFTDEERDRLQEQRSDVQALLTMAKPRLLSLQEQASKAKVPEEAAEPRPTLLARTRIPIRDFIREAHAYIQSFGVLVLPVHPSRIENLSLVLDRVNETMEILEDPEEGTSSEEVKELTANREDLEGLKELAEKILDDLKK